MNKIGIMQGRLSPSFENRIQHFPFDHWQEEFRISKNLGLNCIEWIFDYPDFDKNPIFSDEGIAKIIQSGQYFGIKVSSVMADYFMARPLFRTPEFDVKDSIEILKKLIVQCHKADIKILELPFVDNSSINDKDKQIEVVKNIKELVESAKQLGIKISFETDLEPKVFLNFLKMFRSDNVYVNYDMGNSTANGFDPTVEIPLLGSYIINVHVKDRILNGGTLPLGKGDTDFKTIFQLLKNIDYRRDYIIQGAREDLCNNGTIIHYYKDTITKYLNYIKSYLDQEEK